MLLIVHKLLNFLNVCALLLLDLITEYLCNLTIYVSIYTHKSRVIASGSKMQHYFQNPYEASLYSFLEDIGA